MNVDTIASAFLAAVNSAPDAVYCKTADGTLTYAQAAGAVRTLADELRPDVAGKAVGLILPNSSAFLIAYFATLFAGGVPALINHGHPEATIHHCLRSALMGPNRVI